MELRRRMQSGKGLVFLLYDGIAMYLYDDGIDPIFFNCKKVNNKLLV